MAEWLKAQHWKFGSCVGGWRGETEDRLREREDGVFEVLWFTHGEGGNAGLVGVEGCCIGDSGGDGEARMGVGT